VLFVVKKGLSVKAVIMVNEADVETCAKGFLEFINEAWTPFHAVVAASHRLLQVRM